MTITAECWGTNSAMSYGTHDETPIAHIAATTSMGSQGLRVFMALGAELQGDDEAAFAQAEASLDAQQAVHTSLVNEDIPIMNSLRLGDDHLVAADRKLAHFLRYVRDYPRLSVASLGG